MRGDILRHSWQLARHSITVSSVRIQPQGRGSLGLYGLHLYVYSIYCRGKTMRARESYGNFLKKEIYNSRCDAYPVDKKNVGLSFTRGHMHHRE